MISTTFLLSLLVLVRTATAYELRSPIRIIRPLDDVLVNCEHDVEELCNNLSLDQQYDSKDESLRLNQADTTEYSLQIRLAIESDSTEQSSIRAKNKKRPIGFGPANNYCLWNAFNEKKVSSQCASALTYINNTAEFFHQSNNNEMIYRECAITIPIAAIAIILLCWYVLTDSFSSNDEEDGVDEDARDIKYVENKVNEAHNSYQVLQNKSKNRTTAAVGVPLGAI